MATAAEDLDGQGLADALVANHAALLDAECRELVLAAQWADLHPAESLEPRPVLAGMERPRRFGGFGTPEAGEFCAAELAVLTGRSVGAAATLIADALDLRHRLPLLWTALEAGTVRAWQARHVAKRTRSTGLTPRAGTATWTARRRPTWRRCRGAGSSTCSKPGSSRLTPLPPKHGARRPSWTGSWSPASPPSTA